MEEILLYLQRQREGGKEYFNATYSTRKENLIKREDLMLL